MHTKNISTIHDSAKTFLAPLYDIATTGFYGGIRNYKSHLPINGKQTNIRLKDFLVLVEKANVPKKLFMQKASFILETYKVKMPQYIKKISKLENMKIKEQLALDVVMLGAFEKRIEVLEENLWFEQLKSK